MKQKPDPHILLIQVPILLPLALRKHLKHRTTSIPRHPLKIAAHFIQSREPKERQKGSVRAELDSKFIISGSRAGRFDGRVEVFEDFAGELHAADCADGVGGVVREAPFVSVGEGAGTGEGRGREVEGGVVDGGDVEDVVDWGNSVLV